MHVFQRFNLSLQPKYSKMKKGIHPDNYRMVVFKDFSCDEAFLTRSCAPSKETIKWEDGNEYPLIKLEISSASHPFFTGKMKFVDTAGRIDKFNKKFAKFSKKTESAAPEKAAVEEPVAESTAEPKEEPAAEE